LYFVQSTRNKGNIKCHGLDCIKKDSMVLREKKICPENQSLEKSRRKVKKTITNIEKSSAFMLRVSYMRAALELLNKEVAVVLYQFACNS
jgi:hypothetical protein